VTENTGELGLQHAEELTCSSLNRSELSFSLISPTLLLSQGFVRQLQISGDFRNLLAVKLKLRELILGRSNLPLEFRDSHGQIGALFLQWSDRATEFVTLLLLPDKQLILFENIVDDLTQVGNPTSELLQLTGRIAPALIGRRRAVPVSLVQILNKNRRNRTLILHRWMFLRLLLFIRVSRTKKIPNLSGGQSLGMKNRSIGPVVLDLHRQLVIDEAGLKNESRVARNCALLTVISEPEQQTSVALVVPTTHVARPDASNKNGAVVGENCLGLFDESAGDHDPLLFRHVRLPRTGLRI